MRGCSLLLVLAIGAYSACSQPLEPAPFTLNKLTSLAPQLVGGDADARNQASRTLEDAALSATEPGQWADALMELDAALAAMMPGAAMAPPPVAMSLLEAVHFFSAEAAKAGETAVDTGRIFQARRLVIRLFSLIAPADQGARLEAAYREPKLRPAVLDAWLRMRGPGLRSFLETRLLTQDEVELLQLIPVYAAAFPEESVPPLVEVAKATASPQVFWAILPPLAERGVAPSQVSRPRPDFSQEQSREYVRLTLRAAQVQESRGACDAAQQVYLDVVERNAGVWAVRAALDGLARCKFKDLHRVSLGYINDPNLRAPIIALLATHLSAEGEKALRDSWGELPPLSQAAVLQILHARDAEAAKPDIERGMASMQPAVRYTAALLAGAQPDENDLWELATAAPDWLQAEALQGYLRLAEQRMAAGDTEGARRQYLSLLQGGMPLPIEQAAITGLGRVGNPEDKTILEQLSVEKPLRGASESAMVSLASRGGSVEERAEAVSKLSAKEVPQQEMDALVAEVTDIDARHAMLLRAGFMADGLVAGPMSMEAQSGMQQLHFPILPSPTAKPAQYSGQEYPWQALAECARGSTFDIAACLQAPPESSGLCAYLVYETRVPVLTGVHVFVQHDDGFALFNNGKFVRAEEAPEAGQSWSRVPALLDEGLNTIVVKLAQHQGPFTSGLRITTRDGKPFDLTRQEMPPDPAKPLGLGSRNVKRLMENIP